MVCQRLETIWLVTRFFSSVKNILIPITGRTCTHTKNSLKNRISLFPLTRGLKRCCHSLLNNLSKTKKTKIKKKKKTQQSNVDLLRNEERVKPKEPQKSWKHISAKLSFKYERKDLIFFLNILCYLFVKMSS